MVKDLYAILIIVLLFACGRTGGSDGPSHYSMAFRSENVQIFYVTRVF
jgi:hypothetical protein